MLKISARRKFSRLSEKMHIFDFFRDIFSVFGAFSRFLGVKFGFQKSCLCKRNDKYQVCHHHHPQRHEHLIDNEGQRGCR